MKNNENDFPPIIQDLIEIVGINVALEFVKFFGGTTLVVNKKGHCDSYHETILYENLGENIGKKILNYFRGESIYIPRCAKALREIRHQHIKEEFDLLYSKKGSNALVKKLAIRYGVSDRTVWRILKK